MITMLASAVQLHGRMKTGSDRHGLQVLAAKCTSEKLLSPITAVTPARTLR